MAKLFVCGDIVNIDSTNDFVGPSLAEEISKADYAVCNFEGPELEVGQTARCPHQVSGTAAYLKAKGFDLMLLANNHIAELGAEGIRHSISVITSVGADWIGAGLSWKDAYRKIIRDVNGVRLGFINVCEAQKGYFKLRQQEYGYAWLGYDELFEDVRKLSMEADQVVVFVHAGLEHYSIPLPEYRQLYRRLCDYGASCVIASHPHCAQGFEYYGNKFIAYSLGNFYFPRNNNVWQEENSSYSLIIDLDKNGIKNVTPIFHYLDNGVVDLAEEENKIDLKRLCSLLEDDYENGVEKMCVSDYEKTINKRLAYCFCGEYDNITFLERMKNIVRFFIFRQKYVVGTKKERINSLLPLFENETRRFSIIRALMIKKSKI